MCTKNPVAKKIAKNKGQTLVEYLLTMLVVFFLFWGFYRAMSQIVPVIYDSGASYIVPPYEVTK